MRKKHIYRFLLIVILLGTGYLFLKGYHYNKEIDNYKNQTVCKFISCKEFPKSTRSFFLYYVHNKSYKTSYGRCPENYEHKLGGFFILDYSDQDPNKIKVDFSRPVTDTIDIINSGFKSEDIQWASE